MTTNVEMALILAFAACGVWQVSQWLQAGVVRFQRWFEWRYIGHGLRRSDLVGWYGRCICGDDFETEDEWRDHMGSGAKGSEPAK